jgi:hypothetical protein
MLMPTLKPIPIDTKNKTFWQKVWILLTCVRNWELVDDWVFFMPCGTPIVIPKGFVMDGASTPRFMWGLLDPVGILLIQGIIHDYGYRYNYLWAVDRKGCRYKYHEGQGREFWDKIFLEVGLHVNEMQITGYLSWLMLRLFGGKAWEENRIRNAPELLPQ